MLFWKVLWSTVLTVMLTPVAFLALAHQGREGLLRRGVGVVGAEADGAALVPPDADEPPLAELLVLELQAARAPGTVTSPAAAASPLRAARRLN